MEHAKQHPVLAGFKFVFSLCLITFLFWVCNSQDKKKEGAEIAATFKMNCIKLNRAQVQVWVDKGWTKPANADSLIKKILLQYYSSDAANGNANMKIMAFPGKSFLNVYPAGQTILEIDTTCVSFPLTGKVAWGNNYARFDSLKITNGDGSLTDFSFIRFRPVMDYPPYINFRIEVVRIVGAEEVPVSIKGGTDPCPHYCVEN